jgi:hypothetical protein
MGNGHSTIEIKFKRGDKQNLAAHTNAGQQDGFASMNCNVPERVMLTQGNRPAGTRYALPGAD